MNNLFTPSTLVSSIDDVELTQALPPLCFGAGEASDRRNLLSRMATACSAWSRDLSFHRGTATQNSSDLCRVCQTINADEIFQISNHSGETLSSLSRTLGTYNEISRRRQCQFCKLVASSLQKNALPTIVSSGKEMPIRLYVLREQKGVMQPTVRLRLVRPDNAEIDLIEVRPVTVGKDRLARMATNLCPRGIQMVDLRMLNIHRIKLWLETCQRSHESCIRMRCQHIPLPGFHLIDTVERLIVEATLDMEFFALSYVWGSSTGLRSRKFSKTLPKDLPRTIQDAIDATGAIGIRYLWVDALCIPQEDPEVRSQQVSQMDKIYRSAVAVIVAATGRDAEHGLGSLTRSKEVLQPATWLNGVLVTCVPFEEQLASQPRFSPWSTRGWTLQEGVLAQRRIIFTDEEIILDCGLSCVRETASRVLEENHGYLSELQRPHFSYGNTMTLYTTLVGRYLQRDLTYDDDAVDAFQGISNFLAEADGTKCCWTLPRSHFLTGISWYPADSAERPCRRNTTLRAGRRRCPSWSWSAWKFRRIDFETTASAKSHLDWTEAQWQLVDETGILEIDNVDVVQFNDELSYDGANLEDMKIISHGRKAWKARKGCWISLEQWLIQRPVIDAARFALLAERHGAGNRFALLVEWHDDVAHRIGYNLSISQKDWVEAKPVKRTIKLG